VPTGSAPPRSSRTGCRIAAGSLSADVSSGRNDPPRTGVRTIARSSRIAPVWRGSATRRPKNSPGMWLELHPERELGRERGRRDQLRGADPLVTL
jgi:hypothetical protein